MDKYTEMIQIVLLFLFHMILITDIII